MSIVYANYSNEYQLTLQKFLLFLLRRYHSFHSRRLFRYTIIRRQSCSTKCTRSLYDCQQIVKDTMPLCAKRKVLN